MTGDMFYLDHNASSPLRPEAWAAMQQASLLGANPSSVHGRGRAARAAIEKARHQVGAIAAAREVDIVFTSGASEANTAALWGAVRGAGESGTPISRILVSAVEHDSILASAAAIGAYETLLRVTTVAVTRRGAVDLDSLHDRLRDAKGRTLVVVMAANNETGVIQPLEDVMKLAREFQALVLVDAAQACGKIDLHFATSDADYLSLSAHKIGGAPGTGALVVRRDAPFVPLLQGGGQERGRRAGTENVAGIAAFGAAAEANLDPAAERVRIAELRDRFERELQRCVPSMIVFGGDSPRLANTTNFALPGLPAEVALMALDLDGVMLSSGAACSSGKVSASHVLKAMQVPDQLSRCALRASFGWNSTAADVDAGVHSLEMAWNRAHSRKAA